MADDDQQQQRYWFPYWSSPPAPARAPRPVLRPQLSRRDTRPAAPQPPVTPSPSRRQPQPAQPAATTAAPRAAAAGTGPPQAQPQPTRVSSRTPPPPRGQPLSPVREPDSSAAPPAASATEEAKPPVKPDTSPPQRAAHEAVPNKELDIVVPQEKIIREPPSSDTNTQSKSVGKAKEKENDKEKDKEKMDKDAGKEKEKEKEHKEKEKEHKEKGKEKEKEHKEKKDKDKKHKEEHVVDESKVQRSGKLHKELKSGIADMVHKLGATVSPSSADRHAPGTGSTVITLAGENKGASMKISHAKQAESNKAAATTTTKEPRARNKLDGRQEARGGARPGLTTAFVNSNVQVVNNSLVLQSSCSSNDPGVHLNRSFVRPSVRAEAVKQTGKVDGEEGSGGFMAGVSFRYRDVSSRY